MMTTMTTLPSTPTLLVLLPGMDGTGQLFTRFASTLQSHYGIATQVIAYPAAPLDYPALEAMVRSQLPREQAYIVLAESFSGPLGATLRGNPPPGMRGLVLCCSFVRNPRPRLASLRHLLKLLPFAGMPGLALRLALLAPYATPVLLAELSQALAQVPPKVLRERLQCVLQADASHIFASGSLPVLYLRARHDRLVPPSNALQIMTLAPGTQLAEIDAPHMLLQAALQAAANAIATFMQNLSALQAHSQLPA